jgi:biopolymer transport protein ExbB
LSSAEILELLQVGALTTYPLGVASVLVLAIVLERFWCYWGMEKQTREVTRKVIDALARRDTSAAQTLCEKSKAPIAEIFLDGLRWRNIALEDLERVLATSRQEGTSDLRRGLWVVGTIGSLAPFIGLFGTVVGIMKAFRQIAVEGAGGFEVVAAGISEALVATAVGLLVAIIALAFYNYLQVRVGAIGGGFARSCERFVQALLYVETAGETSQEGSEVRGGDPLPA